MSSPRVPLLFRILWRGEEELSSAGNTTAKALAIVVGNGGGADASVRVARLSLFGPALSVAAPNRCYTTAKFEQKSDGALGEAVYFVFDLIPVIPDESGGNVAPATDPKVADLLVRLYRRLIRFETAPLTSLSGFARVRVSGSAESRNALVT